MSNIPGGDDSVADMVSTTNPPAVAPNGVASFFSFLGNALGTVVTNAGNNALAEMNARSAAQVQRVLNTNHAINPATGANDPNAAQVAANRTFLEKFLPSTMLYQKDASGVQTLSPTYYLIIAGIAVLAALLIVKLFRK